jgi:hypothetical protein
MKFDLDASHDDFQKAEKQDHISERSKERLVTRNGQRSKQALTIAKWKSCEKNVTM